MGRYQGNFGGLGIYGVLGYSGSGNVHVWGATPGGINGTTTAYNGFRSGDGGLALTYAGFTVGGNVLWGAFNGQVGLKPQGGANAVAWVAGAQYAVGPVDDRCVLLELPVAGQRCDDQQVAVATMTASPPASPTASRRA